MNFNEYLEKGFPELSVRERTHLSSFHNFIKYLAIRFGFILFKLNISANFLDTISLVLSIVGFYFLSISIDGYKLLPIIGVLIIFFHVWVDFIDGVIAKARGQISFVGHQFDNLGCDADRFMLIVLFGIYTQNNFLLISNIFVAYILVVFHAQTRKEILKLKIMDKMKYIYNHKLSLLGVRFMLGICPLIILLFILIGIPLSFIGFSFTSLYSLLAIVWLIMSVPVYNK